MSAPKYSAGVLSTAKRREKHAPLPGSLLDKEERNFHSLLVLYRVDISTVTFMDIICKETSKICMLELSHFGKRDERDGKEDLAGEWETRTIGSGLRGHSDDQIRPLKPDDRPETMSESVPPMNSDESGRKWRCVR